MSRRVSYSSSSRIVCSGSGLAIVCGSLLLSGCLLPVDIDPRFIRIDDQLREAASVVGAERAAELFDPGAPHLGGAPLCHRRAAFGLRVARSNGFRPDLSTADANPSFNAPRGTVSSTTANSQTVALNGAVRLYAGRSVGAGRYAMLGLDGLTQVATVVTEAPGDAPSALAVGIGGRLGLLSDREERHGLSVSLVTSAVPGVAYETAFAPTAPATAAEAALRVDRIRVTALRLQGSIARRGWGVTAGVGTNSGKFNLAHRARITYADSVSRVDVTGTGTWSHDLWNVGVSRRLGSADVTLQYGQTGPSTDARNRTKLLRDTDPRRSLSLGVQLRY